MSTAFHPEPNGLTAWMKASMEQDLWAFVNHQLED
jgi:hypothetical protein